MELVKTFLSNFSRCPFVKIFSRQNFVPYGTYIVGNPTWLLSSTEKLCRIKYVRISNLYLSKYSDMHISLIFSHM